MEPHNRIKHFFQLDGTKPETTPRTSLEEKQSLLRHYVMLIARGLSNGLFVVGPGGLGKSHTISKTLAEEAISPVLLNSHVTPLALYRTLFFNRTGRVIWLDDCDSIYGNLHVLGLLRSALWGTGQRIITYSSSQLPDDLPPSFIFDSKIIFCANVVPKRNEAFKAVLTRVDTFELTATNEEIIEQMRLMANRGFESLTPQEAHLVVDFIEQAGGTRRLSMRLLEPSWRKYAYAQEQNADWKALVSHQLDSLNSGDNVPKPVDSKAHDMECFREAVRQFPQSVKDQERFWRKATGKSRASFFRLKKSFGMDGQS